MKTPVRLGAAMYVLAALLLLALMTLLFDDAIEHQRNPNRAPQETTTDAGRTSIALQQNRAGHYVFDGFVNGMPVEFLLDTGATDVSVPASVANELRLQRGARLQAMTANGMTAAYATTIDKLAIGTLEETGIRASIVPNLPGEQILLGMSFLKRLDFSQRGDTLILTQRTTR
jgi:aspartyl protease family protein